MKPFVKLFMAILFAAGTQNYAFAYSDGFTGFFVGYNGAFSNYAGLNNAINYYNARRPQLTHKLENVNYMQGVCAGINLNYKGFYGEMQWTGRHVNIYSQAEENGKRVQRDIKYRNNTFHVSMGLMSYKTDPLYFGLGVGMDFGDAPIMTRKYTIDADGKPDFETIPFTNMSLAFSINAPLILRFSPLTALMIKPYYMMYAWEHNYYDLHDFLDPQPNSYTEPDEHEYKSFPHHFGIQTSLLLGSKL